MKTFGQMCPDLLVLHAFVTTYNWQSGPLSKVWMWTSTAARLIKCLQLNYDPGRNPAGRDFAQQETLRRTVWLIWVIDQFLAGGFNEHLLLPSASMHLKLPCGDEAFKVGAASTALTLKESSLSPSPSPPSSSFSSSNILGCSQPGLNDFSLTAALIRLLNIRSQILRYVD